MSNRISFRTQGTPSVHAYFQEIFFFFFFKALIHCKTYCNSEYTYKAPEEY